MLALTWAGATAQNYINPAPEGGFDIRGGKDYVVLYAPQKVVSDMGSLIAADNNLDPAQVKNTLEYWVCDWDKTQLTIFNVEEENAPLNSFGIDERVNATPLFDWGTGVFVPRSQKYDLSKVTDKHHLHIGLRDFGSAPSQYKLSIGSQSKIKNNGFQIQVNLDKGASDGDFVGVGKIEGGNDGKWYYLDIPVSDLIDENGDFGFTYDFSQPIADGVFSFSFNKPTCSTYTFGAVPPGETLKSVNITKIGSALSLDHVFFYVPTPGGIEGISDNGNEEIEAIYDITGNRVNEMTSGLYIVKTSKGVKKVMK